MEKPAVKILAVSNVYCRLMHFKKKGDVEHGHFHDYDHGTLLAKGKLLVEKWGDNGEVISSRIFTAPTFIFIDKNNEHQLTALEDDTVATCIHALRTIDETIIDPAFFVEEKELADSFREVTEEVRPIGEVMRDKGLKYKSLAKGRKS